MVLVLEQGFTPPAARGQTVFQVWQRHETLFQVREVPFDTPETTRSFQTMGEAISFMRGRMVECGFEPKGPGRAKHLPPRDPRLQSRRIEGSDLAPSRFDRKDVL